MRPKKLGIQGEKLALNYLKKLGYRFIDRNYSCRFGEIDLILKDKKTLVFVEVKSGKAKLSSQEKNLKETINKKKVKFAEYRIPEELTKKGDIGHKIKEFVE